jgi:hypothetical protein
MKRCVLIVATFFFVSWPSICTASYVIELESGSQLVVNHYWEEDNRIAFYFHGGVVAIPKDLVRTISESDLPHGQEASSLGYTAGGKDLDGQSTTTAGETSHGQVPNGPPEMAVGLQNHRTDAPADFEYYKKHKNLLKSKLEEATRRFREASGNRNLEAKKSAIQDMTKISKEMFSLAQELEAKNNGVLPEWWK